MTMTTSVADNNCHTSFDSSKKTSLLSVMLGMTVCFSTLWRFPYQTANFGGGAFVAIYLILAALFVYPALTAEWGLGRLTGRGPEGAYKSVRLPGNKFVSFLLFGIVLLIGSYFVVWIGWILRYAYSSFADGVLVQSSTNSAAYFDTEVAANPILQMVFSAIVVGLVSITILGGKERIQKVSSIIVPIFYVMIVIMTTIVLIQPGVFISTFTYLTTFDSGAVTSYTFVTALGQAFFSLCLGGTFMVLYGSYLSRDENHNIPINSGLTVIGNTIASLISVLLIIGLVNLAGFEGNLSQFGPGLFFGVIPEAFQSLALSTVMKQILLGLFFVLFFFAAYLPMTAIIEVTTVAVQDNFEWSRRKSFLFIAALTLLLAIPSAISPLSGGFLYNLDIFVGAIGLVFGSIIAIVAFMWFVPKEAVLEEVNTGSRFKLGKMWYNWTKYVTPIFMILIILYAISDVLIRSVSGLYDVKDTDYVLYRFVVDSIPYVTGALALLSFGIFFYDTRKLHVEENVKA